MAIGPVLLRAYSSRTVYRKIEVEMVIYDDFISKLRSVLKLYFSSVRHIDISCESHRRSCAEFSLAFIDVYFVFDIITQAEQILKYYSAASTKERTCQAT